MDGMWEQNRRCERRENLGEICLLLRKALFIWREDGGVSKYVNGSFKAVGWISRLPHYRVADFRSLGSRREEGQGTRRRAT